MTTAVIADDERGEQDGQDRDQGAAPVSASRHALAPSRICAW
jgi:hypothetical protein